MRKQRFRVLLLIPHLGGGGAERVIAQLARGLSRDKYELHLGLITQTEPAPGTVPEWVIVHALAVPRVRSAALPLLRLVRTLQPDLILSGIAHLNFLVLLLKPFFPRATRIVVRQNSTISASLSYDGLPAYTRLLYHLLYLHADRVICQTRAMAEDLAEVVGLHSEAIRVLPNPVDLEAIRAAAHGPVLWQGAGPHLLAIGRLSPEKGFDLLLESMAAVRQHFPAADLKLLGQGPEESRLRMQCKRLGLSEAVHFAGYTEQPYGYFPGATLLVLPSRHEGMPNALLEAAAAGLPLVATPASGGIREFLTGRANAWLASETSTGALTHALLEALTALQNVPKTC
ncbi:glycosyltransferase [Telmatobacter bradus]|uniref:glycosyltransferase n=1 Tax=Telmatobacter bradus TaxID=474953 RepID=UPI003B42A066